MRRAHIVVGAGYGDEGKGLATDFLVNELMRAGREPVVVRANGGAQAGHTVQTPEGRRHVHKHHGSGSLLGANTYLSSDFVANPIAFCEESEQIGRLSGRVLVSPAAQVTIPLDMMINQWVEIQRGSSRHGSCGWGVNETVTRGLRPGLALSVADLPRLGVAELHRITETHLEHRLGQLGYDVSCVDPEWRERFRDGRVLERYLLDVERFLDSVTLLKDDLLDVAGDAVVFEGAQGLGLDQEMGHFPYVTRSYTGSRNPLKLCEVNGVDSAEILYVTRCYATRHGAGPLENEGEPHGAAVEDETNQPNLWQGSLRTAPLNLDVLRERVQADFRLPFSGRKSLSVLTTCLDQAPEDIRVVVRGKSVQFDRDFIPAVVSTETSTVAGQVISRVLMSRGPTREDVSEWMTVRLVPALAPA